MLGEFGRLVGVRLAYLLVLPTPGLNTLAVGGVAAVHGPRGALPLCCGIAPGAGTRAGLVLAALYPGGAGWVGQVAKSALAGTEHVAIAMLATYVHHNRTIS